MRFQDMPYERIDFAKVQEEMGELIRELDAAKSGEEQFEVHKKYYALTDRVMTLMTIANIRFDIDTSDKFYEEEHKYYDEQGEAQARHARQTHKALGGSMNNGTYQDRPLNSSLRLDR